VLDFAKLNSGQLAMKYKTAKEIIKDPNSQDQKIDEGLVKAGSRIGIFYNGQTFRVFVNKNFDRAIELDSTLDIDSLGRRRGSPSFFWPVFKVDSEAVIQFNFGQMPFSFDILGRCNDEGLPFPSMGQADDEERRKSDGWWNDALRIELHYRFPELLPPEDDPQRTKALVGFESLRLKVDMALLAKRLEVLSRVVLTQRVHDAMKQSPRADFSLSKHDVESLKSKVVHMGLIEFAEAAALVLEVKGMRSDVAHECALLEMAISKMTLVAHKAAIVDPAIYFYWGNALEELAHRTTDVRDRKKRLEYLRQAMERYSAITQRSKGTMIDDTNSYYARAHLHLGCVSFEVTSAFVPSRLTS